MAVSAFEQRLISPWGGDMKHSYWFRRCRDHHFLPSTTRIFSVRCIPAGLGRGVSTAKTAKLFGAWPGVCRVSFASLIKPPIIRASLLEPSFEIPTTTTPTFGLFSTPPTILHLTQFHIMSSSSKDEGGGVAPQNKGSWSSFLKVLGPTYTFWPRTDDHASQ